MVYILFIVGLVVLIRIMVNSMRKRYCNRCYFDGIPITYNERPYCSKCGKLLAEQSLS